MFANKNTYHGFTLIELLIALTLSGLVLAMLTAIYISTLKNLQTQNALTALAENARVVTAILRADLRNAGNVNCGRLQDGFPVVGVTADYLNVTANSLTVHGASAQHAILLQDMLNPGMLIVDVSMHFKVGDIVVVSNCKSGEIFSVLNVSSNQVSQTITADHALSQRFLKTANVSLWQEKAYFIESDVLYVRKNGGYKQELVRGVKDMKISLPDASSVLIKLILAQENLIKAWFIYAKVG